jgi:hypothetical protein
MALPRAEQKSEDVGVSILTFVSKYGASSLLSRLHKVAAILSFGADDGLT